jgi:hypothetical protein
MHAIKLVCNIRKKSTNTNVIFSWEYWDKLTNSSSISPIQTYTDYQGV